MIVSTHIVDLLSLCSLSYKATCAMQCDKNSDVAFCHATLLLVGNICLLLRKAHCFETSRHTVKLLKNVAINSVARFS